MYIPLVVVLFSIIHQFAKYVRNPSHLYNCFYIQVNIYISSQHLSNRLYLYQIISEKRTHELGHGIEQNFKL